MKSIKVLSVCMSVIMSIIVGATNVSAISLRDIEVTKYYSANPDSAVDYQEIGISDWRDDDGFYKIYYQVSVTDKAAEVLDVSVSGKEVYIPGTITVQGNECGVSFAENSFSQALGIELKYRGRGYIVKIWK